MGMLLLRNTGIVITMAPILTTTKKNSWTWGNES
jgi:hypothetical protein